MACIFYNSTRIDGTPIFGETPNLPVNVPLGVTRWKIRVRPMEFTTIFLKYSNRIEKYILYQRDNMLVPGIKQSENIRGYYAD